MRDTELVPQHLDTRADPLQRHPARRIPAKNSPSANPTNGTDAGRTR
jgi:hypothetical protein